MVYPEPGLLGQLAKTGNFWLLHLKEKPADKKPNSEVLQGLKLERKTKISGNHNYTTCWGNRQSDFGCCDLACERPAIDDAKYPKARQRNQGQLRKQSTILDGMQQANLHKRQQMSVRCSWLF